MFTELVCIYIVALVALSITYAISLKLIIMFLETPPLFLFGISPLDSTPSRQRRPAAP